VFLDETEAFDEYSESISDMVVAEVGAP